MAGPHLLGPGWEAEIERAWDEICNTSSSKTVMSPQTRMRYQLNLEKVVGAAIANLRNTLGNSWLSNRDYGTALHNAVQTELAKVTTPAGWQIEVERPLSDISKLPPNLLSLNVSSYLSSTGRHLLWLSPLLGKDELGKTVGKLRPDLVIREPSGVVTVWDLTYRPPPRNLKPQGKLMPQKQAEYQAKAILYEKHLAKTILYANLLTQNNQLARIGETYWMRFR